jgi:hypothetical protein
LFYVDNIFNNNNNNNNNDIELKNKEIQFGLISKELLFQSTTNKLPDFLSAIDISINDNFNSNLNNKSFYMILSYNNNNNNNDNNNDNNNNFILNDSIEQKEKEIEIINNDLLFYDNEFIIIY